MALYSYTKDSARRDNKIINIVSYASIIIGSLFLFWSFYPIISFEIYSRIFINKNIATPISVTTAKIADADSVLGLNSIYSTNLSDFTKAGLWFPSVIQEKNDAIKVTGYTLSIPKLNITDAKVIVGGEDLNEGLIHYAPKCLPGEKNCNVPIFGHSTLAQLSKRGNDYKSIFTYLPTMDRGDKIFITLENNRYEYEVSDIYVVKPEQVSILDQTQNDSVITLVTCVPPGLVTNRLAVRAKLISTLIQ